MRHVESVVDDSESGDVVNGVIGFVVTSGVQDDPVNHSLFLGNANGVHERQDGGESSVSAALHCSWGEVAF